MNDASETSCARDDAASRVRFGRVLEAFEQAWQHAAGWQSFYMFAGERIRLRSAGATLARHIDAPLTHLRAQGSPGEFDLTIDLWDVRETGISGLVRLVAHAVGRQWILDGGILAASPDGSIISHAAHASTIWLDRRSRRIAGWVVDGGALSLYERARPLQILLALWASDRGVHAVHGALVARGDRGVLLPGDSGSGKSTAALCCVQAGFTYLGDDWIGIGRAADGAGVGYSLYSSVSLEPAQIARFPRLQTYAVPPRDGTDLKSLILLSEMFPTRLGHSASICALALPRVVDTAETSLHPASKKEALLTMARSSIFTMRPRGGRDAMEALTRLAQVLPACWLEIGHDLEQIPPRVDEILAAAAP